MFQLPPDPFSVLITRPAGRADHLLAGLEQLSIPHAYQPLITTQQVSVKAREQQLLKDADLVIAVSIAAVTCLETQMDLMQLQMPLFAVGRSTAAALQRACGRIVYAPADQRSEGLLAMPELLDVTGKHVVIVRGNAGRELIKQGLVARGARVSYVQSYKRVPLPLDGQRLSDQWRQQQIQCIVVTSNEILSLLFQSLPETAHEWLRQRFWVLISPRMQETAISFGIAPTQIMQADSANDQALLDAICQLRRKFHERTESGAGF